MMTTKDMFEKSFERPNNFFELSGERQWEIDKSLGILDWDGSDLTKEEIKRFRKHYNLKTKVVRQEKVEKISNIYKFAEWYRMWYGHPDVGTQVSTAYEVWKNLKKKKKIKK